MRIETNLFHSIDCKQDSNLVFNLVVLARDSSNEKVITFKLANIDVEAGQTLQISNNSFFNIKEK